MCRKSVERLWKGPVIIDLLFRAVELLLILRGKGENVSTCNQKFELVICQLNILLPQASFSTVTRLRTEDRRRQVRLQSVARHIPLCHCVQTGPRAQPSSYLMGHYVFAKRLSWRSVKLTPYLQVMF